MTNCERCLKRLTTANAQAWVVEDGGLCKRCYAVEMNGSSFGPVVANKRCGDCRVPLHPGNSKEWAREGYGWLCTSCYFERRARTGSSGWRHRCGRCYEPLTFQNAVEAVVVGGGDCISCYKRRSLE